MVCTSNAAPLCVLPCLPVLCSLVYQMANQPAPNDYSAQLYEKFSGIIAEYCANTVKPSLEAARQRFDMAFLNEVRGCSVCDSAV